MKKLEKLDATIDRRSDWKQQVYTSRRQLLHCEHEGRRQPSNPVSKAALGHVGRKVLGGWRAVGAKKPHLLNAEVSPKDLIAELLAA